MSTITVDESLIERVTSRAVSAVLSELGYAKPDRANRDDAEYMSDPEIRRRFFSDCTRNTFALLVRRPGFPAACQPGGEGATRYRRVADMRRWLSEQAIT